MAPCVWKTNDTAPLRSINAIFSRKCYWTSASVFLWTDLHTEEKSYYYFVNVVSYSVSFVYVSACVGLLSLDDHSRNTS